MSMSTNAMDPMAIIYKYYDDPITRMILIRHSRLVAEKALRIAERLSHLHPDREFIREAALLHDIGIFKTDAPGIGCRGRLPYICHGILGREILEQEGFPRHGLVCERHVGAGISLAEIGRHNLPLPHRDMLPRTLEEEIVCYADKFFTKKSIREKPAQEVIAELAPHGKDQVERFCRWRSVFEPPQV